MEETLTICKYPKGLTGYSTDRLKVEFLEFFSADEITSLFWSAVEFLLEQRFE